MPVLKPTVHIIHNTSFLCWDHPVHVSSYMYPVSRVFSFRLWIKWQKYNMEENFNESEIFELLCMNQFPFPKYLDPCADQLFCVDNFTSPFLHPCSGKTRLVAEGIGCIIILCGVTLNIFSFVIFGRMTMNAESLFLMKCLAIYDTCFLVGGFIAFGCEYLRWILGFGYDRHTAYLYVDRLSYYCFFRMGASMSYWTIAILTVQRYVGSLMRYVHNKNLSSLPSRRHVCVCVCVCVHVCVFVCAQNLIEFSNGMRLHVHCAPYLNERRRNVHKWA